MTQEEFYAECAAIFGLDHAYSDQRPKHLSIDRDSGALLRPLTTAKRGGLKSGRTLGNGRFPGFGVVRDFGSVVHVTLTSPWAVRASFQSREDAVAFLRELFRDRSGSSDGEPHPASLS